MDTGHIDMNQITTKINLEQGNWGIIIEVGNMPFYEWGKESTYSFVLYIEYKSSINEWGKQIDAFFRQINKRKGEHRFLLSFDKDFLEYEQACEYSNLKLIVLSKDILDKLNPKISQHISEE